MKLTHVVPWGRNMQEYIRMFKLSAEDLNKNILSVGDGPASFNQEMKALGRKVISVDPIYHFSSKEIQSRIEETRKTILLQMSDHSTGYIWKDIRNVDDLEKIRMGAMNIFLNDFARDTNRYLPHALPDTLPFEKSYFDLSLSSHFLFLYDHLGVEFHIRSITEMMRVSYEARFFPLLNLRGQKSKVLDKVQTHFSSVLHMSIEKVPYEFQRGANEMLVLSRAK